MPATLNLKPDSGGSATRVLFRFRPALRSQRTYAPVQVLFQSCARPGRTIIDRASRGRISGERHCSSGTRQCVTHECEAVSRTRRCINHARQPFDSLSITWPLRDRECITRKFFCVIHIREPNDLFPPVQLLSSLSTIGNPCGINHHPAVQGEGGGGRGAPAKIGVNRSEQQDKVLGRYRPTEQVPLVRVVSQLRQARPLPFHLGSRIILAW